MCGCSRRISPRWARDPSWPACWPTSITSFRRRDDKEAIHWVTRFRAAIPGQSLADRVSLADTLAGLGHLDEAAAILEEAAQHPGTPDDAGRTLRARARGLLAPYN